MHQTIRSRKIIIANTAMMLIFVIILVTANLFFLNATNTALRSLDEHHNKKIYHILKLEEIARERSVAMLTMYMSDDPWVRDREFMLYHEMATEFILHREQLLQIGLSDEEQKIFTLAMDKIKTTQPMQNTLVERIYLQQLDKVRDDISSIDLPMEAELHEIFEKLAQHVQMHATEARIHARDQYRNFLIGGILASGIIMFTVFLAMRTSLFSIANIEEELLQQTQSLDWEANHDPLTQLLNRRGLALQIKKLNRQEYSEARHTLLYIDLDNFKPVNDQYGHEFGDKMLIGLGAEFHSSIRKGDAIARIGGDEFAVVLEDCDTETALRVAKDILKKTQNFVIQNEQVAIKISGCSIGLLPFTAGEYDVDSLLKQADMACYHSKTEGKNRINIYQG